MLGRHEAMISKQVLGYGTAYAEDGGNRMMGQEPTNVDVVLAWPSASLSRGQYTHTDERSHRKDRGDGTETKLKGAHTKRLRRDVVLGKHAH